MSFGSCSARRIHTGEGSPFHKIDADGHCNWDKVRFEGLTMEMDG